MKPIGVLKALFPPPTATGAPRTMLGYRLGQFACFLGRHRIFRLERWSYEGRGDLITEWCDRDRCGWSIEWWTNDGRPRGRTTQGSGVGDD